LYDRLAELERDGPLVIIDLHTTSGPSDPFVCFGDTLENRRLGLSLPITAILGLEEVIDGAMLGYYTDRGHTAISIETGQHRDPESVIRHEAAIWLCLSAVGAIARSDDPDYEGRRSLLAASSRGRPRVVDVRYRHVVRPEDEFVMDPGYRSFDPVASGRIVARDRRGPVRAPISGLMLMPRYQGQGEDGFFLVRRVAPFWLTVSSALRQIHAENVVSRLPGVTREDHRLESLIVDTSVARYLPVELMHLCGYRRTRRSEGSRQYWKKRDR
jgi:succinylglutamate desuccinylase